MTLNRPLLFYSYTFLFIRQSIDIDEYLFRLLSVPFDDLYNQKFFSTVLKEFDILKKDDVVYKLVGPVLLKQDLTEATQNVQKRIDYIQGEMYEYILPWKILCI